LEFIHNFQIKLRKAIKLSVIFTHHIAEAIAAKMRGVEPTRNMIIVRPTHHIARGFLLERTPYKKSFYLWLIFVPLFNPIQNITLNYGRRISVGENQQFLISVEPHEEEVQAQQISNLLNKKYLAEVNRVFTPSDFRSVFTLERMPYRPNIVLDYAIACCLSGDISLGISLLKKIVKMPTENKFIETIQDVAKISLIALEENNSKFQELIAACEIENIEKHFPGVVQTNLRIQRA
jgi:hypothetical protein